jgi:DNA-binding transcriptional MerR regulator
MTATTRRGYRIGDVAEAVGVTARTIRYYEELGLLGPGDDRTKGSHRIYDDADIARIRELVRLRDLLGLTLDELTQLADDARASEGLRAQWEATTSDAERLRIIREAIPLRERQLELVRARQRNLAEFEEELKGRLTRLRRHLRDLEGPARR